MLLIYKWLLCASIGVSLPKYRVNNLKWTLCGDKLQLLCTTLMVPLGDSTLKNSLISIDLVKYEAKVRPPKNTIIFHPDGPGIRGVKYLQNAFPYFAELFDNSFDVISFNHRGLSNSHLWDAKRANDFAEISLYYAENLAALSEWTFLEQHSRKTAEFIGEVKNSFTTTNIARDLEFIRLSLGMKKMNFWGIGYGSLIGTIYANMFPKSVGHMVLDGAMDPTRYFGNPLQHISDSVRNLNAALIAFTNECDQNPSCGLYSKDEKSFYKINSFLQKVAITNPVFDDRSILREQVEKVLHFVLSSPSYLLEIIDAIKSGEKEDYGKLHNLIIKYRTHLNDAPSFLSILCADHFPDFSRSTNDWFLNYLNLKGEHSVVGDTRTAAAFATCENWKTFPRQMSYSGPWNSPFENPVLLIGNTYNPTYNLKDARNLQHIMKRVDGKLNSVLLIQNSYGYASVAQKSSCTRYFIRNYFLNDELPENETICENDEPLFGGDHSDVLDDVIDVGNEDQLIWEDDEQGYIEAWND